MQGTGEKKVLIRHSMETEKKMKVEHVPAVERVEKDQNEFNRLEVPEMGSGKGKERKNFNFSIFSNP